MLKKLTKLNKFFFRYDGKLDKKVIWALIPCLAGLILGLVGGLDKFPFPDCQDYLNLSSSLYENLSFSHSTITPAWRTPGYPLLIMFFAWLGKYSFLVVNLLLLFGTVFFSTAIAEKWQVKPLWAIPLLFILSPGLLTLVSVPLSEIAFTFFFITAIYAIITERNCIAGLCLSYATLCRPIGLMLFIFFIAWLIWKKRKVKVIIIFAVLANLLPALWVGRNYLKYDHAVYTSLSGYNLLYYKAGSYLSWKTNTPLPTMNKQLGKPLEGIDDPFEKSKQAGKLGRKILLENFWGFCLWAPRNMVYFFMPDINPLLERLKIISGNRGTYDVLRRKGIIAAFNHYFNGNYFAMALTLGYMAFYAVIALLTLLGIVDFWRQKKYPALAVLIIPALYFMVLPIGNLDWRFRMPIIPISFIFVIAGLKLCHDIIKHLRRNKQHSDAEQVRLKGHLALENADDFTD